MSNPISCVNRIGSSTVFAALCAALVLLLSLSGCNKDHAANTVTSKPVVMCTTLPLYCVAAQVAGEAATVELLPAPQKGPHAYQFTLRDRERLSRANVILQNGFGLESPDLTRFIAERATAGVVVAAAGDSIPEGKRRQAGQCTCVHHNHGHDAEDDEDKPAHKGWDAHIWLGRIGMLAMVDSAEAALKQAAPKSAAVFEANATQTRTRINTEFDEAKVKLAPLKGRKLLTFHDAWGYFAEEFGFQTIGALTEAGETVTIKNIEAVRKQIRNGKIRVIFAEPQYDGSMMRTLAKEEGASVAILDPCEQTSAALTPETYFTILRSNVATLVTALAEAP